MLFGPGPAGDADSPASIAEIQPGMEVLLGLLGEPAGALGDMGLDAGALVESEMRAIADAARDD